MSNMDEKPQATVCGGEDATAHPNNADGGANGPDGDANVPVELITAREVLLGGPRAMTVRRTLPQRKRSMIGA